MFYYKDAFGPSWACPQKPVMFLSKNFKGISAVYSQPVARDAPLPWQITFQDPATPGMEGVIDLHHEIMFYITIVVVFILWVLVRTVILFNSPKPVLPSVTHHVELGWVFIVPALLFLFIINPALSVAFASTESIEIPLVVSEDIF